MAKLISAKCPSCGANLPIAPGVPQVTCRYCQNVITVEAKQPPPNVSAFGTPGYIPSRTLYVDPAAIKAAQQAGRIGALVMILVFALPFVIGIGAAVGPWALRSCKGAIKPFPISCGTNEEVEVSGTYEGTGPIVTSAGTNCKIHVKNSKLKGSSFIAGNSSFNVEVTFENVQIETTETMFKIGSNSKLHLIGSTLVAQGEVIDSDTNFTLETTSSTLESKSGTAVKNKLNMKVDATGSKFRGKKSAFDTTSSFELDLKKACEVTSIDGPAIKSTSGTKIEAEGGKIEGGGGAIDAESSLSITATGITISSSHDKAIHTTSSYRLDLVDSSVTSATDSAIDVDGGGELLLTTTTVSGVNGIEAKNGLRLKATKKSRILGTRGLGILGTLNLDINLTESSIESTSAKAIRGSANMKMKLGKDARVAGKLGAIDAELNLNLDATGASIEGGSGPGILTANGTIAVKQGVLKGNPAIQSSRNLPIAPDLTGTRVEGAVVVVKP